MPQKIAAAYLTAGMITSAISAVSTSIFYAFGPGAIWHIGFVAWMIGGVSGLFFSVLRVATWPYGIYVLITNPDGFFPWLFYHWYL